MMPLQLYFELYQLAKQFHSAMANVTKMKCLSCTFAAIKQILGAIKLENIDKHQTFVYVNSEYLNTIN